MARHLSLTKQFFWLNSHELIDVMQSFDAFVANQRIEQALAAYWELRTHVNYLFKKKKWKKNI